MLSFTTHCRGRILSGDRRASGSSLERRLVENAWSCLSDRELYQDLHILRHAGVSPGGSRFCRPWVFRTAGTESSSDTGYLCLSIVVASTSMWEL